MQNATKKKLIAPSAERKNMSANIHIRLSEEKKKELTKQAQKEGLSLNAFMLAAANDRIVKMKGE